MTQNRDWPKFALMSFLISMRDGPLRKNLSDKYGLAELPEKTPSQNHPKNKIFRFDRGSNSYYIGNQPLYFQYITLSKVIRAQRGFLHHKVAPWPQILPELAKKHPAKIIPKIACSVLSGDPTAATSATNHSIFVKWPWVKLLGLKRGFLCHKVAPQP